MAITFNGATKIISFDSSTTEISVQEIYSRWVDWLLTGDNSKYLLAMRNVGGDDLPGARQLGISYFFLNGWKLKPYEETHSLTIMGNLYSEDGSSPITPVLGSYNVTTILSVSNLIDIVSTGEGGGTTASEIWGYSNRTLSSSGVSAIRTGLATVSNQSIINEGVKKASKSIPHSTSTGA